MQQTLCMLVILAAICISLISGCSDSPTLQETAREYELIDDDENLRLARVKDPVWREDTIALMRWIYRIPENPAYIFGSEPGGSARLHHMREGLVHLKLISEGEDMVLESEIDRGEVKKRREVILYALTTPEFRAMISDPYLYMPAVRWEKAGLVFPSNGEKWRQAMENNPIRATQMMPGLLFGGLAITPEIFNLGDDQAFKITLDLIDKSFFPRSEMEKLTFSRDDEQQPPVYHVRMQLGGVAVEQDVTIFPESSEADWKMSFDPQMVADLFNQVLRQHKSRDRILLLYPNPQFHVQFYRDVQWFARLDSATARAELTTDNSPWLPMTDQ